MLRDGWMSTVGMTGLGSGATEVTALLLQASDREPLGRGRELLLDIYE